MDRKMLGYAEERIRQARDNVGWGDSRDPVIVAREFLPLCDAILAALAAVQRSDSEVLEDAERWIARLEARVCDLTKALNWCQSTFTGPNTDEELREGWQRYVAPLLPENDDGDAE